MISGLSECAGAAALLSYGASRAFNLSPCRRLRAPNLEGPGRSLAQAFAECPHARVRRELWGYAAGETREIKSLTIASGALPRRAQELVLDWPELHQQELLEDGRLCMENQPPKPIAPLK